MNPSRGFPTQGHIWAAQDTQNLAWPGPASTPALALLPMVKGTLWGQKATHCVTGDKGAGDRGAGRRGATTPHPPSSPCRGIGSLEFPLCALQATPGQIHNPAWGQLTRSGLVSNSAKPPFCHLKSRHVSYHIESLNKLSPKGPLCARRCYRLQGVWGGGREPGSQGPHPQACRSQPGLPRRRGRDREFGVSNGLAKTFILVFP